MTKAQLKERFTAILALDNHPGHIAAGFAVGVFISITPFFGLHTVMAVATAFLFRLNKLTTITGAWVNTPFTVPPLLLGSYKLGAWLLGQPPKPFSVSNLEWSYLKTYAEALLLGSSVIGLVAAVIGYFLCYWLVLRFRRTDPGLAELTQESLITGEDLDQEQRHSKP
jgi:uncharacterized protein (TIGR03546 family)